VTLGALGTCARAKLAGTRIEPELMKYRVTILSRRNPDIYRPHALIRQKIERDVKSHSRRKFPSNDAVNQHQRGGARATPQHDR
jgi:hypothetical protein